MDHLSEGWYDNSYWYVWRYKIVVEVNVLFCDTQYGYLLNAYIVYSKQLARVNNIRLPFVEYIIRRGCLNTKQQQQTVEKKITNGQKHQKKT